MDSAAPYEGALSRFESGRILHSPRICDTIFVMKRICIKCNVEKPVEEFYSPKGKIDNTCKSCHREYRKNHYKENKDTYIEKSKKNKPASRSRTISYILDYLREHPCSCCGETDMRCLQFDHIDPNTKSYNVSHIVSGGYSVELVKAEIAKCVVLCANCHAKKTAEQFQYDMYKGIYY